MATPGAAAAPAGMQQLDAELDAQRWAASAARQQERGAAAAGAGAATPGAAGSTPGTAGSAAGGCEPTGGA